MVHEYDDDFLTFRDLTDSKVTLFRYQAIDTLQLMILLFIWVEKCSMHFDGSHSFWKIWMSAWPLLILETRLATRRLFSGLY
jgi:hypothetical protein